jgi:hypothetical protein
MSSNPISFLIDGKQRVAIAAGRSIFVFGQQSFHRLKPGATLCST